GDAPRIGGQSAFTVEQHAASQALERVVVRLAIDLRPVSFRQLVARIAQTVLQWSVIGQKQQALAVAIEPSGGIDAAYGDVGGQRFASGAVGELRQDAVRFVEQKEAPHVAPVGLL